MSVNDKVFLRVYLNDELKEVFQSAEIQIVIGLEGDAHLKLTDPRVSSVHALIEKRDDGHYLCDLGSKNGTFKAGKQVLDEKITSGESFEVGPYKIEFFIGLPKPVAASKPAVIPSAPSPKTAPPPPPPKAPPSGPKKDMPLFMKDIEPKVDPKSEQKKAIREEIKAAPKVEPKRETPKLQKQTFAAAGVGSVTTEHFSDKHDEKFQIPNGVNGTYAPESQIKDMSQVIKPSKGSIVEICVVWKDRIIDSYHFQKKGVVTIGGNPKCDIFVPALSSRPSHPILKIDQQVNVIITSDMNGEVTLNDTTSTINDLIIKGKLKREGVGYTIGLEQSSVVKVELSNDISVFIRYVSPTPRAVPAPFLLLTSSEFAIFIGVLLFFGILAIYFAIYSPDMDKEELKPEEQLRKAVFLYDRPKQRFQVEEVAETAKTTAQPIKDQEKATSRGQEGKASAAAPNKSKSTEKKLTTPVAGTGKGIVRPVTKAQVKPDSGAKSQQPDPTKTGMFSAFGSKGLQDQLSKAYSGSGTLGGLAGKATGTGGQAGAGAGNTPGTGLKDIGAGGEGTSTYGISGVKTQGRGGGATGYGTGNLGAKPRATIVPGGEGESFTGTIDKEAIRKVIRDNLNLIQACYEKALNRQPNLFGRLVIEWVITTNGRVASAKVASTDLNNTEVQSCVVSRFKTFKFPEPPPDQEAVVSYPFVFNSK